MAALHIGKVILGPNDEEFELSDYLGRGAFGEVYVGKGKTSGLVIAVKLLPFSLRGDKVQHLAMLNETRTATQISHPNVVQMLHVNDGTNSDIGPFTCMEFISGGTLAAFLDVQKKASTKIRIERCQEIMVEIAQGLKAVNSKLVHRDIKPDNILIQNGTMKIADFGISKFIDQETRTHTFKGGQHVEYMAPEAWNNEKNTHKIDVYAAGIVFYQTLALEHPFLSKVADRNNFMDWQRVHTFEALPDVRAIRPDVSLSISQLLFRMTAKRPKERPEWEEIVNILANWDTPVDESSNPEISRAVQGAIASSLSKFQQEEQRKLEFARQKEAAERSAQLYWWSCNDLLQALKEPIEEFNRGFQLGKIVEARVRGNSDNPSSTFTFPMGRRINVDFFDFYDSGPVVRGKKVMGGGWIGIEGGRSANLVLFRNDPDDLYGEWTVCEIKIMALVSPGKLVGRFGITAETVEPFGFRNSKDFYEQIQYANGGMHIFTYQFLASPIAYFPGLVTEACR